MSASMRFTWTGMWAGMRASIPLALIAAAYGAVFGMLARQVGMRDYETVLMSGLVYAGGAQIVALDLWDAPLPVLTLVLTTLVVNLRLVLLGAALCPWLGTLPPLKMYGSLFFLSDESWALALTAYEQGERDAAFLLGSGFTLYGTWVLATLAGYGLGTRMDDPARWGLDFAFPVVFAALLVGRYTGTRELVPWAVAATVAVVAERWVGGSWYILLGGIAGSIVGMMHDGKYT